MYIHTPTPGTYTKISEALLEMGHSNLLMISTVSFQYAGKLTFSEYSMTCTKCSSWHEYRKVHNCIEGELHSPTQIIFLNCLELKSAKHHK